MKKTKLEEERDYVKMKYDILNNTIQAMLPDETVKSIYSEFMKRLNEWENEYNKVKEIYNELTERLKEES